MRRHTFAALVLATTGFVGGLLALHSLEKKPTISQASATDQVKSNKRKMKSLLRPAEGNLVDVAQASDGASLQLDCHTPEGNVLRIGETTISAEAFCDEVEQLAGPAPETPSEIWLNQARRVKERVIDRELVRIALAEEGVMIEESAIDEALVSLNRTGTDLSHVREHLRTRLEWKKLLELRAPMVVSDEEVFAAYSRNPAYYGEPARATVTGYALRLAPSVGESDVREARQKAQTFQKAAAEGDVSSAKPLGLTVLPAFEVEEGGMEAALAEEALRLGPGRWSAPIRTKIGWVVVHVEKVRPAMILPFDEVAEKVKAMVKAERQRNAETNLRNELRAEISVEELVQF